MAEIFKAGATSKSIDIFIQDSTSTTGAGKTALAYNDAGWKVYYRKGATGSATSVTLATQTVGGAYSSGGFVKIDDTNMPGVYRFDIPNAAIDTVGFTTIQFSGVTGMVPVVVRIQCVAYDPDDTVRLGLTALPNAAAGANGGLPLGDGSGRVDIGKLLGTAWLTPGTAGTPDVNVKLWNSLTTVALPLVPTTAGRTLDVSAAGEAGIDWANVGSPTTTVDLSGTTISTTQAVASVSGAVGSVSANGITASSIATGAIDADALAADASAEIADAVWDEVLSGHLTAGTTGAGLNTAGSAGDPWTTSLPGAYTGSQAGKMLSDILTDTAEIGAAGAGLTEAGGTGDQLTAITLPSATLTSIADNTLTRSWTLTDASMVNTGYNLLNAARFLRNVWSTETTPGSVDVFGENGTTLVWTRPLTTDAAAEPITGAGS